MDLSLKTGEIVSVLKREIEQFSSYSQTADIGEVIQTGDGIARVYGLQSVISGELLQIDISGKQPVTGIALNLEEDNVGVVLLDEATHVKEGDIVRRTGTVARVPVGEELLGRIVDPLGRALDDGAPIITTETRPVECKAPGIIDRQNVCEPLFTGIKAIDALVPIGRGQRELIIGDRRTGKTALAIDAIINQGKNVSEPVYCFYVAIGQKRSSIVRVVEKLREHDALKYTTVVCATAGDPAPLQYIAPYAACAMAEYFRDTGRHALIIYDDLTKQAQAYRQLSLLLRRPPGREAYPGDIFYLHSRLLERAAKLSDKRGGGSLTALPIVETQAGDISAYIPTNVISITDGQIFLESHLFNSGIRPAINAGISVSRVGGAAQIKAMRQTAGSLRLELAQFRELASFSQFSADLDKTTKAQLDRGEHLTEILKQKQYQPMEVMNQVMIIYAGTHGYLDKYPISKLEIYERHLHLFLREKYKSFMEKLRSAGKFTDELEKEAKTVLEDFAGLFDPSLSIESLEAQLYNRYALAMSDSAGLSRSEMLKFIERATAKELLSPSLEKEIGDILQEPNEQNTTFKDRFDKIVEECEILDIEHKLSMEEIFKKAAVQLSEKVQFGADSIFERLMDREQTSSTALTSIFAVPHLIVPGEHKFALVAVRSKPGISFSTSAPNVRATFFLAGTIDERNTHLHALASIAQTVNDQNFLNRWMEAQGSKELRSIMLSARRKREAV
ncbi:MAG TPA: F0F1 ATP synthase subunit alpha [Chitinispirillaceae bacterium]|nr:F0F1 ATP synthase subunit alpha [Chitinispirillaceae bacterium]